MTHQVCTIAPGRARLERLLATAPPPPTPPDAKPARCGCGQPLEMEMERVDGLCVNCAYGEAVASWRGPQ